MSRLLAPVKSCALLAGAAAAACSLAVAPRAEAADPPGCTPSGGRTLLANEQVQLFLKRSTLYGCSNARKRAVRITTGLGRRCARIEGCGPLGPVSLGGRYVTYGFNQQTRQGSAGELFVLDLSTRRKVRKWRDGDLAGLGPTAVVASAVVAPNGRVAWVTVTSNVPTGRRIDVHIDAGQGDQVVDTAVAEIDPQSLALAGSGAVYWTHSGEPRMASLR